MDSNEELIRRFLLYMRAERGATNNTVHSYKLHLVAFEKWFTKPLTLVERGDLSRYVTECLALGKSPNTVRAHIYCLRAFFCFLIDDGDLQHDPTLHVPMPKVPRKLRRPVLEQDFETRTELLASSKEKTDALLLNVSQNRTLNV